MRKIFTIALLMIVVTSFAQDFNFGNTTNRRVTFTVYAYGTNPGYNSCSTLIHQTRTVNAGWLDVVFGFSGTWYDASNNVVSAGPYGNPVWSHVTYTFACGLGTPASDSLSAGWCTAMDLGPSTVCTVTGTWTTLGTDVAVTVDN